MVMKQKYFTMLDNIKKEHNEEVAVKSIPNDRVLIIDGLNTFIRGFSMNPTTNDDGVHIGGIVAFLNSIGYAIKLLKPTRCIIVFDGVGGSIRRRKIYSDYKMKRRVNQRYNRSSIEMTSNEESKSMSVQLQKIITYLDTLPVTYLSIDNIEADDVIAYAATTYFYKKSRKIFIMSTDKDFLQLLDDKINIWSPTKKKLYDKSDDIKEDFGIPKNNYLLYKVITGDPSDNIHGIKGVKIKTLQKTFPKLFEDGEPMTIDDIVDYATEKSKEKDTHKCYKVISESKNMLDINYSIMRLDDQNISSMSKLQIQSILDTQYHRLSRVDFQRQVIADKLYAGIPNANFWVTNTFLSLDANISLLEKELNKE